MIGRNLAVIAILVAASQPGTAATTQQSFTPTGYRYPIMKIEIAKADLTDAQALYVCPSATAAECLVDLVDTASLEAIAAQAQSVAIRPGEYTRIVLSTCPDGTPGTTATAVEIKGSVAVGATTYQTSNSAAGGLASGGTAEFASVPVGCGGAVVNLVDPVVVTAGSTQTLNLAIDLTDLAWTDSNASPGMGGCRADGAALQDLCTTTPKAVPYVGAGMPVFERYLIAHAASAGASISADANAAVNLVVDGNGEVFYVIVQPYFSPTSPLDSDPVKGGPDYHATVRTLSKNTDASIQFQTGGDASDSRVGFAAFQRNAHFGTCKNEAATAQVWNYTAFPE